MNLLKKWRWRVVGAAMLVLAAAAVARFNRQPEPVYGGRTLSSWFHEYETMPGMPGKAVYEPVIQGMGAEAVPFLRAQLRGGDGGWEKYYWSRYGKLSRRLREYLPAPRRPGMREEMAAAMLGEIGPAAREAVPDMIAAYNRAYLKAYHLSGRRRVDWVADFAKPPSERLPVSSVMIQESSLRAWLVYGLAVVGGEDKQTVPLLLAAVREPNSAFRSQVAYQTRTTTNLDAAIRMAEPTLLRAIEDPIPDVRSSAALMLGALAPNHPEVVALLVKTTEDPALEVRRSAMESLSKTKTPFETLLPVLSRLLDEQDVTLRHDATMKLIHAAGGGAKFRDTLINELANPNPAVRVAAARALRAFQLGPRISDATQKLTALANEANESDAHVREEAKATLAQLEAGTGAASR